MAVPGAMISDSFRMLATKSVTKTKNTFVELQEDFESSDDSVSPTVETPQARTLGSFLPDSYTPAPSPTKKQRKKIEKIAEELVCQMCDDDESWPKLCPPPCAGMPKVSGQETNQGRCDEKHARDCRGDAPGVLRRAQLARNGCGSCWAFQNPNQLKLLTERRPQSLMPLSCSEELEFVEFILDSGATATVIPPSVGKAYAIQPGDASRAGVSYEVANGEEILNLGETLLPVVTAEGSWKGLRAQVADVSKPLQSVRTLVQAGHMVVFGHGDEGCSHYIVNKITGETIAVKDDGTNYLLGLFIAPVHESGFARPEA